MKQRAVWQALFVTFLWSTSWVLIKWGLQEIPPLIFAGLRYGLAFLILLPAALRERRRGGWTPLTRGEWGLLLLLGVVYYALTQGAQFVGLAYLPAVTVNMLLGMTSLLVAMWGMILLGERPSRAQWGGTVLALVGLLLFFWPLPGADARFWGWLAAIIALLANSIAALIGRYVNQKRHLSPLRVTTISMGTGALLLIIGGAATQTLPPLTSRTILLVGWLALVNTAFAFTLWNHTLQELTALQSSMINNSMAVQIPVLAVLFLGERLSARGAAGLGITVLGIGIVQLFAQKEK